MQYLQYGVWTEIYDLIDFTQGITETSRIDDVFQTCTFTAYLENNQNIPPYTPFIHGNKQWVGTSKITQYLTEEDLYVHEVTLMDPSALLKCFIIGVKVYSKESLTWALDRDKFKSLLTQAKRMYPDYTFNYGNSINNKILTSKTYTFDAKATLYDCLNEICVENDVKLKVEFNVNDTTELTIKVNNTTTGTYPLFDSRVKIINHTEDQDSENYGKYLETYASNVVDRNTITKCDYIYPKAGDTLLNADTAKIYTPTAIDKIIDFGVRQEYDSLIYIEGLTTYFPNGFPIPDTKTYGQLATTIQCQINGQTVYFFDYIYENEIKRYFPNISKAYFYQNVYFSDNPSWDYVGNHFIGRIIFQIPASCKGKFTKMNALLEKEQWDTLTQQDQVTRAVYTIGGNTIENLNGSYKNDFWDKVIGQSRSNFLATFKDSGNIILSNTLEVVYHEDIIDYKSIPDIVFFVEYNAITNPYIRNSKTASSLNEYAWKPFSRSYGVGANSIDFDKIMPNMTISNNTLGQIEKAYEVDLTGENNVALSDPLAGQAVNFGGGVYWYISSCIRTKKYEKDTAVLTLVKDYQKKADAIGVDTQSESTNNPLHGIVTRPISINYLAETFSNLENDALYFEFVFYDTNNNIIINSYESYTITNLYSRCSIQSTDNVYLIYCEMLDQMLFDFQRGTGSGNITQYPIRYTDYAAEAGYVSISIGHLTTTGDGLNLPSAWQSVFTSLVSLPKVKIDKDAREHLTFSIMLRKN